MMGMSSRLKKLSRYSATLSIVFIVFIAFLGQTTTSTTTYNIDLTPVTNLLVALLPTFISIMVIVLLFKFVGSIFEGFSRWIKQAKIYAVRLAPKLMTIAFVIIIVFLGQTSSSSTIDLTPIVNLLMALLPVIVSLLVIVLIFRLVGGIFESFGSVFKQQVRIKAALRSMFIKTVPVALILLVGQTATGVDQAQQVVAQLTPILMTLITIVLLIALPILVFKALAKGVLDIIRG
jgi:hypothetical protein